MAGRLDKVRDLKLEVSDENRRPNTGHRRICSKTYARGSDMFPRLDFAVERRASEPGLAGRLGGGRAIEQVTEWLRGTIPGGAAELRAQGETLYVTLRVHIAPQRGARLGDC